MNAPDAAGARAGGPGADPDIALPRVEPEAGAEIDAHPTAVAVLDLPADVRWISAEPGDTATRVTVRQGGRVRGSVRVSGREDVPAQVAAALARRDPALPALAGRPWPRGGGRSLSVSVVLATLGTNALLPAAVRAVLASDRPDLELLVVDNAPRTGATRAALADVKDARLRIVDAPRPGLSRARNAGVAAARGEVVAFTDDDALVDPAWLDELLDVLAADPDHALGAVTGAAHPAQLRYRSQRIFEARGGFPRPGVPVLWASARMPRRVEYLAPRGCGGPLFPFVTARVGAGVSMAFRREALAAMGRFDESLGAGTAAGGGEDLDAFARVLRLGLGIVHTPDALVHHAHRTSMAALTAQTRADGVGVAALLTKTLLDRPASGAALLGRVPAVARRVAPGSERMTGTDPDVPAALARAEVRGFLAGPGRYVRSRREARRP